MTDPAPTKTPTLPVGDIQFYEAIFPPLDDGDYKLVVSQTFENVAEGQPNPTVPDVDLEFSVRGPRFKLNPADIHGYFPPTSPSTPYEGQVPHVVVSRKTLPWERLLGPNQKRAMPWLGLLVIDEKDDGGIPKVTSGTVADLLQDGGKIPSGTLGPALTVSDLDNGETVKDPCLYVDIPAALFAEIAPQLDDLPFLAHGRGVNTANKPIEGIVGDGIYSVLVGNRVVHSSALNAAFLVSFEGFQDHLDGTAPAGYTNVRLAVLHSWTFKMGAIDPFDVLMTAEHSGLLAIGAPTVSDSEAGSAAPSPQSLKVSPPDPNSPNFADETVSYALALGYSALTHHMRDGGQTVSWYRGPLTPKELSLVLDPVTKKNAMFQSSDALLRYNPATGLFDTSYAAAFEIGRMLAMQNEGFVSALRTYLHQSQGVMLRQMNRHALMDQNKALRSDLAAVQTYSTGAVVDATTHWLSENLMTTLEAALTGVSSDKEGDNDE